MGATFVASHGRRKEAKLDCNFDLCMGRLKISLKRLQKDPEAAAYLREDVHEQLKTGRIEDAQIHSPKVQCTTCPTRLFPIERFQAVAQIGPKTNAELNRSAPNPCLRGRLYKRVSAVRTSAPTARTHGRKDPHVCSKKAGIGLNGQFHTTQWPGNYPKHTSGGYVFECEGFSTLNKLKRTAVQVLRAIERMLRITQILLGRTSWETVELEEPATAGELDWAELIPIIQEQTKISEEFERNTDANL
uniref:Uncharacterized protein n=1 Tax=Parascaris univalens TaxID=6257 RepID=A0A915CKY4_PARUN